MARDTHTPRPSWTPRSSDILEGMKRGGPLKRRTPLRSKTRIRKRSRSDLAKAKDTLWELCKSITRRRYGNICYTCCKSGLEGSNWHTGHFLTDATCSTELSYDLKNLRPQCYHCNINLSGNWIEFERRLIADHDSSYVADLKQRNQDTKGLKYDISWYQRKILEYRNILNIIKV